MTLKEKEEESPDARSRIEQDAVRRANAMMVPSGVIQPTVRDRHLSTPTVAVMAVSLLVASLRRAQAATDRPWLELLDQVAYYSETRVVENESFSITCRGPKNADMVWEKDGQRVRSSPSSGYLVDEENVGGDSKVLRLSVQRAKQSHSGDYSCANTTRHYRHVHVVTGSAKGSAVRYADCHTMEVNRTLEIPCRLPRPRETPVSWYRNQRRIERTEPRFRILKDTLVISPALESDTGTYSCQVDMFEALDNNDRDPSSEFADLDERPQRQVKVVSPIRMEPLPAFQVADAGATVSVVCKVLAKPNPRLSWFVDGVPLNVSEQHLRRSSLSRDRGSDVEDAVLTIRDVSPNDRNVYTCRAEHHHCRSVATETSTRLFVWAQSIHTNERFPGSGLLVKPYDDTLELSCSPAANESTAEFDWDKDGARLNASQGVTVSEDTTSLTIRHPTQANAGNYSCKKRGTTETATIEVRYKVTCVIDRGLSSPEPSYWMAGEGARLAAKTTGVPTPQVSWLKDGKLLREDGERILFEDVHNTTRGGLIIRQVVYGDRGVYTCIASNGPDTDKEDVMVRVRNRYAPLVPFVGIVIQVVVLLTIIYVTETRRIRKEAEREAAAEQRRAQREPSIVTDKKDD